jgi:Domain of unknown function (DUF222)
MNAALALAPEVDTADPVADWLDRLLAGLADLVTDADEATDAERVDRITALERLKAAVGAVQVAEIVRFGRSQVEAQRAGGVHPQRLGRGIADQIALACGTGPADGVRRLDNARALWFDMPGCLDLLTTGRISEWVAQLVVTETSHLDSFTRRRIDVELVRGGLADLSPREAQARARRLAYEADPQGSLTRGRTARKQRRVTLRPAPDTMSHLHALLPVEQGVACYASLRRHVDAVVAAGDERSRDQIMADTVVERLTGQAAAEDVNIEVQLVMPIESLVDPHSTASALIPGQGPVPAWAARQMLDQSGGQSWWRRLFAAPTHDGGRTVVDIDRTRRRFTGWLADLVKARDQYCRDPYCTAAIRHIDHIERYADSGPTTLANGRGVCERGNYLREMPGWSVATVHSGTDGPAHTVEIVTPTGHRYRSRAPDPP